MHSSCRAWRDAAVALAAMLWAAGTWMPAAAQQPAELPSPTAPVGGVPVSAEQAREALRRAREYAQFRYRLDDEEQQGVPYKLGGKVTLEEFARLVESSPDEAREAGIDASGLVVQAYRAAVPDIQFFTGPTGQEGLARMVNSGALYRWNTKPIALDEVGPGDLVFFKSPSTNQVTGVALVSQRVGRILRIIVASESRGRVVEVGLQVTGSYWESRVAGLGRLVYAPSPTPATAPPGPPKSAP